MCGMDVAAHMACRVTPFARGREILLLLFAVELRYHQYTSCLLFLHDCCTVLCLGQPGVGPGCLVDWTCPVSCLICVRGPAQVADMILTHTRGLNSRR